MVGSFIGRKNKHIQLVKVQYRKTADNQYAATNFLI